MKLKYRLLSFLTSAALALGLCSPALAAATDTKPAAPVPALTLTASAASVQIGDTVSVSLSVDGSEKGFAVLQLTALNYDSDAFTPSSVSAVSTVQAQGYNVTAPELSDGKFSGFLLNSVEDLKVNLKNAVTYTFRAAKAGTYNFSVNASVSAVGCQKSTVTKAANISVTVSAKTLTASVTDGTTLKAVYGDSAETLTSQITGTAVSFFSDGKAVSVKGTWSYEGETLTVNDKEATFRFTPEDGSLYAPLDVAIPVSISPKALTASLKPASAEKSYDGTNSLKGKYSVSITGGMSSDKLAASCDGLDAPTYASCDVGKDISISGAFKVTGQNLDCYTINDQAVTENTEFTATATGAITPYTGEVSVSENFQTRSYNSSEQPLAASELTLTDANGQTLTLDKDYTISYPDGCTGNAAADTELSYVLTGKGNYEGCTFQGSSGKFTIRELPLPTAFGSLNNVGYTIGETYQAPGTGGITVSAEGTLSLRYKMNGSWSDSVPAEPGEYQIGVYFESTTPAYGSGMLDGITATLTVKKNLAESDFSLDQTSFPYNGSVQTPKVTSQLTENTDYKITFPESTDAGEYKVTVTGQGFYLGEVALDYTIEKAVGTASVSMVNYTYGDTPSVPVPESATNGTDTDNVTYTYTGRDGTSYDSSDAPTAVGKYTVTAAFADTKNYKECTASADFEVTAKGLVADDFELNSTDFTYNGSVQTPSVSSKNGLTAETDYTVSFPESVNAGEYQATVTGQGNYTGSVKLSYTIRQAVYTLPAEASVSTELSEYPVSIYGGQALSLVNLKASGLPEGARFGWKDGTAKLNTNAGTADYEVTIDPNDDNYTAGTVTVRVKTADQITAGSDISAQLSTYLAAVRKIDSDNIALNSGVTADLANLTLSSALTPKQQDDLKSAYMNSLELLKALDASASVTVHTKLDANGKNALTGLNILNGGQAAAGIASGDVTYTAKDITPDKPADGQLIEVELTLTNGNTQQQLAAPILVELTFKAKDADAKGKFQVIHKHTEQDSSKSFSTISDCISATKSGDEVTVQFMAASLSSFSIQYTAPSSGSSSSGSSSATPKPDEPQPTPTPALSQSETTWLGGYSAMLQAKSGSTLSMDVSACEYLPGYIIGGVQKTGVTLNLTTPAGKLVLTPAAAKAMNAAYNYTFADAMAIAGKVAASAASTPAPVKDPTATATPTPQPTQTPTAAPTETPEATPQPTAQPEEEAPAEKSHSALPIVAAILVAALLAAGGYLAYNSASRKKAVREVYAPTKKAHSNGNGKKPKSKR